MRLKAVTETKHNGYTSVVEERERGHAMQFKMDEIEKHLISINTIHRML